MKKITILILLTLIAFLAKGQAVYPVRTYTVLTPPMPYTLNGFCSEPGRMQLNINVDDISLDHYPIYFRLVIKGNGIKLHTKPGMYQEPYYIDGGMNEVLTGFDLEELFNPRNLIFEGYSIREYERTGRLPEGVYQIYVELWDYYHKVNISQAMLGVAVIYLTRAPQLTFPINKDEVDLSTNPNLRFSWVGSMPNDPMADPVYRFNLYEIRPEGRNPYEIINASPPVFTQDTHNPYFIYDMGMPPLEEGLSYAWQVQSVDLEGKAKFQNDGYSDVYTFRYGKACETPEVQITKVTTRSVALKFSGGNNVNLYRIFYKTTDEEDWQSAQTDIAQYTLNDLPDNTGFEIKVVAFCGNEESDESQIVRLKTNLDIDYTCGKSPDNFDVSNTEPLKNLYRYDFFKAADFSIEVVEAQGSNGRYTGSGFALIPYLAFVKFAVKFDNIFINSDRRMTEGSVTFVYDESTGMVVGLGNLFKGSEDDQADVSDDEALKKSTDVQIEVEGEITNIQVSGNTVKVSTKDGKTQTIQVDEGQSVGIVSKGGDTAFVADTGSGQVFTAPNPAKGGSAKTSSVGTAAQTGQYGVSAVFKPASTQRYGFDAVPKDSSKKPDSYFNTNKSGDKIAWKSLASGRTDYLDVEVKGTQDTLRYIRSSGMLAPNAKGSKGQQLLLTGLPGGEEEILTAASVKKEHINDSTTNEILTEAGAIGLVSYAPITKKVVLVPVNGAQCPTGISAVKQALDKVYAPAIVSWDVLIDNSFTSTIISSEGFKDISTNMFSKYTSNMNTVIGEYKKSKDFNKENLYLFFIKDPQCKLQGFMPLTGQYGFIFNFGSNTNVLGHELGHGTFNLRHTFSDKAQHYFPERSTQNLMDYSNGTELWKYQWDLIHDPENMLFAWGQDEEEGAIIQAGTAILKLEKNSFPVESGQASFFSPAGIPITFADMSKMEVMYVTEQDFSKTQVQLDENYDVVNRIVADKGVLIAFKYDGNTYFPEIVTSEKSVVGTIKASDYLFQGYKNIENEKYYTEDITSSKTQNSVYWYHSKGWENVKFCYSYKNYINGQTFNGTGYKASGYYATFMERRTANSCIDYKGKESDLDNLDFFNKALWAKFNPWGKYGLLQQIKDREGNVKLVYSREKGIGEFEYYEYNYVLEDWKSIDIQSAGFTSYLEISFVADFAEKFGHSTLDIVGVIPAFGEVSDLINGLWYLAEGEGGEASLCFCSMLPVVGDFALKTTKYTIKAIKGQKLVRAFELTGEGLISLGKISEVLSKAGKTDEECIGLFAKLLSDFTDNNRVLELLASKITDLDKLKIVLAKIDGLGDVKATLLADLSENTKFAEAFFSKVGDAPELVESWKSFKNAGLDDLARNTDQLAKFDALAKSNNLGLDAKGLEDLLSARTATKNLPWEHPDEVFDAVKRASDANIDGVSIKGFPEPADGNTSFILDNAKQYQKEASGDAFLSFDKNGVSFDNVDADGILIDRKYGHSSVFNADGTVANQTRAKSILEQAKRQLSAVGGDGTKLRWEISSKGGADGIERMFLENADDIPGLDMIKVDHVAQKTIITN